MELRAGHWLGVVPGFRQTLLRREAIRVAVHGSGLSPADASDGNCRALNLDEERMLLQADAARGAQIGLLELPEHLMQRWDRLFPDGSPRAAPAADTFQRDYGELVQSVLGFLRFKQVALPEHCRC